MMWNRKQVPGAMAIVVVAMLLPLAPARAEGPIEAPQVVPGQAASHPSLDNPPQLMGEKSPAAAGIPYYEYFHYSAYAKRSYVPGYTPHPSSLFENPRDYPWALGNIATPYYQWAGVPGWFFSSPNGYQSSVPSGSHALKYNRGELGITSKLARGYPNGLRVVEPVIVPVNAQVKKGGVYIEGGGITNYDVATPAAPSEPCVRAAQAGQYPPPPGCPQAVQQPVAPRAIPVPTPETLEK